MTAGELGADYVAFGAFFPTGTKETVHTAGTDLLEWWSEMMEVPCVAIGGITTTNAPQLIAAGIDAIAVITALFAAPDVERAAREFRMLFDQPPYGSSHEEKSKAL